MASKKSGKSSKIPGKRAIPKETVKRLLKQGANTGFRVSEDAVLLAKKTVREYLKEMAEHLKSESDRDGKSTILARHTEYVLTKSGKCGWNVRYNKLSDESVLKQDGIRGLAVSSVRKILRKYTGKRVSEQAARDATVATSVIIRRIGEIASSYTVSRQTQKKSAVTILKRDVASAVNQMDSR